MTRTMLVGLAVCAGLALTDVPAQAGTFEVLSCGAAGGVNRAWQSFNQDPPSLTVGDSCAAINGGPTDGLFAVDRIPGPPNTPKGRGAGWRLTAPAGTRITGLTAQFYLGQNSAGEWFPYLRTGSGQVLETCQPPGGDPECSRGAADYHPFGPVWTYTLDTAGLEAGVSCAASTGACGNGATLHHAWLALYSTRVQINDPTLPVLSSPVPVPPGSYLRGTQPVMLSASDGTGISGTELSVDGITRSARGRACDYTRVAPCSNEPSAVHMLDTRTVSDGAHTLREVAEDAAGNQASRSTAITVDNTAPAKPLKAAVHQPGGRSTPPQLRWTNPPGQVAPIAAAHWSLCRRGRTSKCKTGSRRAEFAGARGQTGPLGRPLADGKWDAKLWLEDAAGNVDPANAASTLRLTVMNGVVLKSPRLKVLRVRRRGNRLSVKGTASAKTGRVRVSVEQRLRGRTYRVRGRARIRKGRWTKRLRLQGRLAGARRTTLVVRFGAQRGYEAQSLRRRIGRG